MNALDRPVKAKTQGLGWIAIAYLTGAAAGMAAGRAAHSWAGEMHPLWVAAIADGMATLVVFGFSRALNNSSVYDAYWSVAPPLLGLYWAAQPGAGPTPPGAIWRRWAVLALAGVWAVRLTWNCLQRWPGLADEDWRYRDLRARHPRAYWWISLAGLHLMPTAVVYLGCLSLYAALAGGARPLNWVDAAAVLVTGGAIWVEARADWELRRYKRAQARTGAGRRLATGLWKVARHPNYLGEMAFWWGLYLFALAAAPRFWWAIVGPLAITGLFTLVSIPVMERHLAGRTVK